ncbi:ABC transporter substrate-binding protein [Sphingomonas sp.]|uniref:ABC transporter substrate-binding protein n=1 Tax=Sphingomonas sp. TaxID=28214 RepID=UPI0025DE1893|nr:ABC transporter substrate-binding protein [Sphingomonas sp.]MBV9527110.1 ABC transporter substrate-binding protein [Sphingomonas sp.]
MPAFALLAASLPLRVASLNLCSDEYLLLLADPGRVVSVSYLSQDAQESPLWRAARRYQGNRGSIEDVLALRPDLVLTMGGSGRASASLSGRLHIRSLDLREPASLADVVTNLRTVAAALGAPGRADPWVARLRALKASAPSQAVDAAWVSGGGQSLGADSLGAQWLRLAGYRQRPLQGARLTLETMITNPPKALIRSNYRSGQMSSGQRWLDNPIIRRAPSRQVVTDGRAWTCMGPLTITEIERLRRRDR